MSKRWLTNSHFFSHVQNILNQSNVKLCLIHHHLAVLFVNQTNKLFVNQFLFCETRTPEVSQLAKMFREHWIAIEATSFPRKLFDPAQETGISIEHLCGIGI